MAKVSEQRKARMREYYRENRATVDARMADWRKRKRLEFIEQLGGKCVHCSEDNPIVLDFDHIHDNGAEHRRGINGRGEVVRYFSKYGVDTEQFQLLCKNCNWIKEYKRRRNAFEEQSTA